MKSTLIRTLIWATALFFTYVPSHTSQGCMWDPSMDYPGYHLFFPEVANAPAYKPYYFSFRQYYDTNWDGWTPSDADARKANLDDWMGFLKRTVAREVMDSLLYRYKPERMQREARSAGLPAEVITYLNYAKRCEPQVNLAFDPWMAEEDMPRPDSGLRVQLMNEGRQACQATNNGFLRLRYAYQAVRLAHYNGAYQTCVQWYDELVAPLKSNSLVAWWALGHKAGALAELGQTSEANYLFSKAFINCPSKRQAMFASFRVTSEADFTAVLAQCKSGEERTAAYFMRAIDPNSRALEDMQAIYAATPGSELLSVLLAREVCKFENDLPWGVSWGWEESAPLDTLAWKNEVKALWMFARECYKKGNTHNPAFWKLSEAYLAYILNQPNDAMQAINELMATKPEQSIQNQVFLLRFFLRLGQMQSLTLAQEDRFATDFSQLAFPNDSVKVAATHEMERLLAGIYQNQHDLARAYMCQHTFDDLLTVDNLALGQEMVAWLKTPARSGMDRYLRAKVAEEGDPLPLVQEWYGTALLRNGKLTEAKAAFEALPAAFRNAYSRFSFYGEPFALTARDCHECAQGDKITWNKLSLTIEMIRLQSQNTPQALLALGNAWYNISYFGASWQALDYVRSGGSYPWPSLDTDAWRPTFPAFDPANLTGYTDFETQDMAVPLEYLHKAQAAAGSDKELQAKIAFAIAKCTQKMMYQDALTHRQGHVNMLKLLTNEYGKTAFVRGMMKECSYLNLYSKNGKLVELDQ